MSGNREISKKSSMSVKTVVFLGMLTAISYVVMYLSKSLPQAIGFLQLDLKDTIICIGGFLFGPLAAAIVSIAVATIEMFTASDTGFIGFVMNTLATVAFCCTASYIYEKKRTKKGAVTGLIAGTVVLTVVMCLWNYLLTPLYMSGMTREAIAGMIPTVFLPFNLLKGTLNMALILVIYKPVVMTLRKLNVIPENRSTENASKKLGAGFILFSGALLLTVGMIAAVLMGII